MYLGRLRVQLVDAPAAERIHFHDEVLALLTAAGHPLVEADLLAALSRRTSVQETTFQMALFRAPFVQVDALRWGLLERDLPGGTAAAGVACEALVRELEARQVGLSELEARALVRGLGEPYAEWTAEMVDSVGRHDARLRLARGGRAGSRGMGLASWSTVRVTTRREWIEQLLAEQGGEADAEAVRAALEVRFGEGIARSRLSSVLGSDFRIKHGKVQRNPLSSDGAQSHERRDDLHGSLPILGSA